MARFSKDYHPTPSKEAYERAAKTKSIKLRVSSVMSQMTIKNVLSPEEIEKAYPAYKNFYTTIEDYEDASVPEIMAYNVARHVLKYSEITNAENTLKVIKHLDVMSIGDLKETLNPVFIFDKYESQI
jgi:hypothetical protein